MATIRDLLVRLVADSQEKSPRGPAFEPCQSASRYMNAASPDAWRADWPVATPEASLLRTGGQVSTLRERRFVLAHRQLSPKVLTAEGQQQRAQAVPHNLNSDAHQQEG